MKKKQKKHPVDWQRRYRELRGRFEHLSVLYEVLLSSDSTAQTDIKRLQADLNNRITESVQMKDRWLAAHWELRAIIEPILVDLGMPPWNSYRSFMQLRENLRTRIGGLSHSGLALCDVASQPMARRIKE